MNKLYTILFLAILSLASLVSNAQSDIYLKNADTTLQKYLEASKFEVNGTIQLNDVTWRKFEDLFKKDKDVTVIFDVPLPNESSANRALKKYNSQVRYQSAPKEISLFGKELRPQKYFNLLKKEIAGLNKMKMSVNATGRNNLDALDSLKKILVFEIEKTYTNQEDTSVHQTNKYLVEIDASKKGEAKIIRIRTNNEDIFKKNVIIRLFPNSELIENDTITCVLKFEFEESINNTIDTIKSKDGRIRLDQVANRATIRMISATNRDSEEFEIPEDWKVAGKKVSELPKDGFFEAHLKRMKWNGLAYTIALHGGVLQQSPNHTNNFSQGGNFTNEFGYKFGGEILFTKYFYPKMWNRLGWLFGIGTGLSISFQQEVMTNNGFVQNRYDYADISGDTCSIQYSGNSFKETVSRFDVAVPLFIDFKVRFHKKVSLSIQPGVNVVFPFQINYKAEGSFSRWGYYEDFNEKPITDDPFYNYYTDASQTYKDNGTYTVRVDGQLRLNFLLNVFKNHPDNALIIGLRASLPLTNYKADTYDEGLVQNYENYWLNTENDDYHSLMDSKTESYNFFIGLSVGINLIRYKTE